MNVTTGKGFSLMKNTTRNYLVKRFRPVVIFIHRHHPARLLYAFFVFIVLAVIGGLDSKDSIQNLSQKDSNTELAHYQNCF